MTPRPARIFHVPKLAAILWAHQREVDWLPRVRPRRTDLGLLARVIARGWVRHVRDEQGPAGFIARDGAVIHALYVHPRARRRGAGRALLNEAKASAARLELWAAEANHAAHAFYSAEGFRRLDRSDGRDNDEGLPEVRFIWEREAVDG